MRKKVNPETHVVSGEIAHINMKSNFKGKSRSGPAPQNKTQKEKGKKRECLFCGGKYPHPGGRPSCPASGETCGFCSMTGHFESKCLKKNPRPNNAPNRVARQVRAGEEEQSDDYEEEAYLFRIYN